MQLSIKEIQNKLIKEYSKVGKVSSEELMLKIEKYNFTPKEIEIIYNKLNENKIEVIDMVIENDREKDLLLQLEKEISLKTKLHNLQAILFRAKC